MIQFCTFGWRKRLGEHRITWDLRLQRTETPQDFSKNKQTNKPKKCGSLQGNTCTEAQEKLGTIRSEDDSGIKIGPEASATGVGPTKALLQQELDLPKLCSVTGRLPHTLLHSFSPFHTFSRFLCCHNLGLHRTHQAALILTRFL